MKNANPNKHVYSLRGIEIQGMKMNIKIKNLTDEEQNVSVQCKETLSDEKLQMVKNYLNWEGFNEEATKYNYEN